MVRPPKEQIIVDAGQASESPFGELLLALAAAVARRGASGQTSGAQVALEVLDAEHATGALAVLTDPIDELVGRFGLTPTDRRLLVVALLPELHPAGHLLLGLLSGDEGAARPSVAVALELAGLSTVSAQGRQRLAATARLRRHGLLSVLGDDVFLARRLQLCERVVAALIGDDSPPARLLPLFGEVMPVPVEGTTTVAGALERGAGLVWVTAGPGTAGTALAAAACQELGVVCLLADLRRAPQLGVGPGEGGPGSAGLSQAVVRGLVAELVLEAALDGCVLILAGAELAAGAMDLITGAVMPVIAVATTAWDTAWATTIPVAVTAPRLTPTERGELWWVALGGQVPQDAVTGLRLTPEQITAVGRLSLRMAEQAGTEVTAAIVQDAARRLGRGGTKSAASTGSTAVLDDLVLPERTRDEVSRLIAWAKHRDDVFALGDLQGKGGKGTGIAALFSGSPGTGKTLAAHVVADALGMDLFQVDLSSVVDKYIGETEKNLEKVFAEAESLNCVLFFDEADSLFGSRSAVSDSKDRYANQEVAYLLQRMESFDGITVLATNLRGNLDQAFARRLHFMIHFPDPDAATRASLWEHHLAQLPALDPEDPVDVAVLAENLEVAGGDIRNIVLSAAYEAVAQERLVGMRDLHFAVVREFTKLGRRVPAKTFEQG
ncbi:ATPase family associated with various cellular activities (AAA) [Sanguibacter gelidistatuariae]|uniref:ATPase family associated with various cellular activities (AAA) n=1 Tax=Sanguibacter gelidistatuariae TaxID=1814289 RepID=A0A1G6MV76_9MICO|nr:ATPase family associated with various cellular activities (AAA) [Sanguibacter gelidistatuariae]